MEKRKVLVIDDEGDIREMFSLRLKSAGYDVETAVNGQTALEKVRLYHPDVVICDVRMPEMDGFTMLKELKRVCREEDALPDQIPVIMVSGKKRGPEVRALFEMEGISDYLEKPVDGKKLLSKVEEALAQKP